MTQIITSKHGRKLGLGPNGELITTSGKSLLGEHGAQFKQPSLNSVVWFDDFLGDALDARYTLVEGTDSATADATILAGGIGGVLRLTTGDAGTGLAADLVGVNLGILAWQASNGGLEIEAKIKLSQITEVYAFLGFTDVATLEAPIISAGSGDTITTTASDAVGWMFDTRMTTDDWWMVGVAGDTDATKQDSGYAPVAATYERLRIEVSAAGKATFYRNGVAVGSQMTGAVTAATDLVPVLYAGKLSTTSSATLDADYLYVAMDR